MAGKRRAIVLDSWAVLAFLGDEPAGGAVADLFADAQEVGIPLIMSTINAGEVWYILAREVSETDAERAIADLHRLGIELVAADWALARVAGGFKARCRMSYADCFAAALAKIRNAELVTGDKEFRQVETEVKVRWL